MRNILENKYVRYFFILGAAYVITSLTTDNLFLAKSPKINPFFVRNMSEKVKNTAAGTVSFIAGLNPFKGSGGSTHSFANSAFNNNPQQAAADAINAPLAPLSQGVYAGEKDDIKVYAVKLGEFEYNEYTLKINGKEVKIRVPKGQEPPPDSVLQTVYK